MDSVVRGWAIVQQLKWEQLLPGLGVTRDKAHRTPTYTGFRVSGRNRRDGLFMIIYDIHTNSYEKVRHAGLQLLRSILN